MAKHGFMPFRRTLIGLLATALVLPALPALAAGRPFPVGAQRGTMTPGPFPQIIINGKIRRMAPGCRIFGQNNLIILSNSIQGSNLLVNFLEDGQGNILTVWILTAVEASQPAPAPAAKL